MQVAIKDELVVAISNKNYAGQGNMLATWMEHVKRAGVTNAMVVALDEPTREHAAGEGLATMVFTMEVRCTGWGLLPEHLPQRQLSSL